MSEVEVKVQKKEHPVARVLGWLVTAVCMVAVGWMARELMPQQAAPDAAAMMAAAAAPVPLVVAERAAPATLNPPREYIGHVEAIQDVDLRAQIDGYILAIHFVEGASVKAGDPLFTIDPERYEARVALRKAEIGQAQATLDRAERYLKRLEASDSRAIIQSDLDTARSDVAQGRAAVNQAVANLALAEIDLKHTRIFAPVSGRVGRTTANVGDYVAPSIGTLLRIVQFDPVRVVFAVSDRDHISLLGSFNGSGQPAPRIRLRLPTGEVADMQGAFDFANNLMSQETATIPLRARFENGASLLVPGGYVTVLLDHPEAPEYPVVRQSALTADRLGQFLFTIDDDGKAHQRRVQLGTAYEGRVEIREGLKSGELVIVEGTLKVQDGQPVQYGTSDSPGTQPVGAATTSTSTTE